MGSKTLVEAVDNLAGIETGTGADGSALPANFDSLPRDTSDRDAAGSLLSEVRTDGVTTWTWTYDRGGVVGGPVLGESGWVVS